MKLFKFALLIISLSSCSIRNKLTFFPDKQTQISNDKLPDYIHEKWIKTTDKEKLQSFLFQHSNNKNKTLIIYFHGNAGNLYSRLEPASRLFLMDHDVLLISYRGYSKSTGKPSEKGIFIDGKAAINYALNTLGYSEENIIIFGRSLGTTVATHISQNQNFRAVVLVTPLTSGKDMAKAMGLGVLKFIAGDSFNSIEKVSNLQSKLLIIHGTKDEVVPYFMGEQLYEKYSGEKQLVSITNGMHNNLQEIEPNQYWGEIEKFLKAD